MIFDVHFEVKRTSSEVDAEVDGDVEVENVEVKVKELHQLSWVRHLNE